MGAIVAQKVQVILVDDVDGGEADETVTFSLDGVNYEIDLSEANAESLREFLGDWIGHARRVGGRASGRARSGNEARSGARTTVVAGARDLADVRSWARDNGHQVSDRGRVALEVLAAYDAAHLEAAKPAKAAGGGNVVPMTGRRAGATKAPAATGPASKRKGDRARSGA